MSAPKILVELKSLGSNSYKKILLNHGVQESCFGVKVEYLKKIQKRVKHDYQLALDLYATGNYDAMYLAGLIADDAKMTKKDLNLWVKTASPPLANYTVAWVAAGSPHGRELALEWIDSKKELIATAGWSTLGSLVSIAPDDKLDLAELKKLLGRVEREIHKAPNDVRSAMNGFVIAVGSYVVELTPAAIATGEKIGPVSVDMGNTACEVPFAPDKIQKNLKRTAGKKRKSAKC